MSSLVVFLLLLFFIVDCAAFSVIDADGSDGVNLGGWLGRFVSLAVDDHIAVTAVLLC